MKNGYFDSFKAFIKGPGKGVLFTSLFYTLWVIAACISATDFELKAFPDRMIGISTLDAFDVGARVSLFYKCLVLFFGSFVVFNLVAYLFFKINADLIACPETRIINYCSLAGILFYLFLAFDYGSPWTFEIIYFLHKLMLGAILLRFLFFKKNRISVYHYSTILVLATALYFFIADCNNLAGYTRNPDFLITTFVIACLLIIALNIFFAKASIENKQMRISVMATALWPVSLLPVMSILKDELYFVLSGKGLSLGGQLPIFVVLIALVLTWMLSRYKKANKLQHHKLPEILALRYFPTLIFSLTAYAWYSLLIRYSNEMFESGNKYLPIMEYKLFGVIPTLEKFNSHLLSDYFFSAIYTLFNGLKGTEMELYDFLYTPFSYLLYYYLMYYLSRNAFIAIFCILFFPFYDSMFTNEHAFAIIGIFALNKILTNSQTLKTHLLFFGSIVFLILWRIDVGYACALALPVMLLYYNYNGHPFKIKWALLFKAICIIAVVGLLTLAGLSWYRSTNLFFKSLYALNYFTSAQTYGYNIIGWTIWPAYKMHYFVFPVFVCLVLIALALKFKVLNKTKGQRLAYLSLVFICLYYLMNFNRGLIRHSLMEMTDNFVGSFIYVIIPGVIFVFFSKQSQVFKFIMISGISFFILTSFKFPDPKGSKNIFETCMEKIGTSRNRDLSKIKNRIANIPADANKEMKAFVDFVAKNMKEDETFIDFANNPILYFYTQKISPSYFYQNPLCSHNEFLQKQFVSDLEGYKTPYLLFSAINEFEYDIVDQVPNTLRHYRMAEYFFNNYEPYVIAGKYCLWKNKNVKDNNKVDTLINYQASGSNGLKMIIRKELKPNAESKKYVLKIVSNSVKDADPKILYNGNRVYTDRYLLNDSTVYYTLDPQKNYCSLALTNDSNKIRECLLMEYKYLPDYRSQRFLSYNFKKLPYIWGAYDGELNSEPVLFENAKAPTLEKEPVYKVKIPANLDKSNGNTVVITLKNSGKENRKLTLSFGNGQEKNRTSIVMDVIPSNKQERYAIRISSIYRWYDKYIDQLELSCDGNKEVELTKVQITKGM